MYVRQGNLPSASLVGIRVVLAPPVVLIEGFPGADGKMPLRPREPTKHIGVSSMGSIEF